MKAKCICWFFFMFTFYFSFARENVQSNLRIHNVRPHVLATCSPSTSFIDLDIGNIRARILINGDMWSDLIGHSKYEVPKNSGKYSLYAGALWIGGTDIGGNLKVAAQTYRQSGSDFWPGPLDTANVTTDASVCLQYDRHWKITRQEVQAFRDSFLTGNLITPSLDVQQWPGNGAAMNNQAHFLAPFHDANADGIYDWHDGDYPAYDFSSGATCNHCDLLHGDQSIWWVFNDMGNIHAETGGIPIGLEMHAQAFAYNSGIPNLDNATFYEYKLINRSAVAVHSTYFGQWVDPDLGNFQDDYIGCDVGRGMGYCYNGDSLDDGIIGYGLNPPAVGVDFLVGPSADVGDGIDNDRDSCIDCTWMDSSGVMIAVPDYVLPEVIKMSKFNYYNNDATPFGNPISALDYYNYMKGVWKNGIKMTYGGTGHGNGAGATTDTCDFLFPGNSDPDHWGTHGIAEAVWDETTAGNTPGDRRFLQSAGPFTFQPGAVQCIMTAAIWARTSGGGQLASVAALVQADDQIQQYFNSCFTTFPTTVNNLSIASVTITVYPNPFQDFTTVSFQCNLHEPVDLMLYNTDGKIVRSYKKIAGHELIIQKKDLNAGVYLYKISSDGNTMKSGKLVIIN